MGSVLIPLLAKRHTLYISFDLGAHSCIGKTLAYHEMRYVLARVVLAFEMEFKPGFDIQAFRNGMLNMRTTLLEHNLYMKVTSRPNINLDEVLAKIG